MVQRPTGVVTFFFSDIEGSTRLWEECPDEMPIALERHDDILRSAIESHHGYIFSRSGDAFAAAFGRPEDAVDAAIVAQRVLATEPWPGSTTIRVRMGLHTGSAQERGGDYFGQAPNRAARVMSAGHGGQVVVAESTASLVDHVAFDDLGRHRLKDLSGAEHLYQLVVEGLTAEFPRLRTVDAAPGNLPSIGTTLVGRDNEVKEVADLVRAHRLVTLTGVGGVGKTRLAFQVAAELVDEYGDGVWSVELAQVDDQASVADAVATALGVRPQAGRSVTDSVVAALIGRRILLVLDNCEHVIDAAAGVVEAILGATADVSVITTSREGLGLRSEHVWAVPSLDVRGGADSAAVQLFVERAEAVVAGFTLDDPGDREVVTEICVSLDGIALAIELAAARMVSMNPTEVRDRLDDRFRLLSGTRRSRGRHQTLRQAVAWSYDLLDDDERVMLDRCSTFVGGFRLTAATDICGEGFDEYAVLDLLESLVRKSLITAEQVSGQTRYELLETIRQFARERLDSTPTEVDRIRARHARFYANEVMRYQVLWAGPNQPVALEWVAVELANLRSAFRWAADAGDVVTATAIAAHTVPLSCWVLVFEPISWAAEVLDAAVVADVPQLPRLYTSASFSMFTEGGQSAVDLASAAVALEGDPRYDPFEPGWSQLWEVGANVYAGHLERSADLASELARRPGVARVAGLMMMVVTLPAVGRAEEARLIADETLEAARALGNPHWIAMALLGAGRAFADTDPVLALERLREGLELTRATGQIFFENTVARDAGVLEGSHGDLDQALDLFDSAIDACHRSGSLPAAAALLASLVVLTDRMGEYEMAATIYGTTHGHAVIDWEPHLGGVVDDLRAELGDQRFDECVGIGTAMEFGERVQHARQQIRALRMRQIKASRRRPARPPR